GSFVQRGIEYEFVAGIQRHRTITETANADLRPLQVREDGNIALLRVRRRTNAPGHGLMVGATAVGEIEPEHIDPGGDQAREHVGAGTGRAHRGNNLGPSEHGRFHGWPARKDSSRRPWAGY